MSTELDLRDVHRSHEPDPTFVAELERRLDAMLADGLRAGGTIAPSVDIDAEVAVVTRLTAPRRSGLPTVLGVAAAVMLVATVGVVVWRQQDPAGVATTQEDPPNTADPGTVAPPMATSPTSVAPVIVPVDPWLGVWLSIDTDGSNQTLEVAPVGSVEYEIVIHDDATVACTGPPATITGTGQLTDDETLVIAQAELTCDDGAIPVIGPPPQPELANFTLILDPETDQLIDPAGVVWWREGASGAVPTSITVPPQKEESIVVTGVPTADQQAIIIELVDAVNAMAADAGAEAVLPDLFTESAVIRPAEDWNLSSVTDTAVVARWVQHLRAWGFEGDLTTPECWTEGGGVFCPVRARWRTVLAEADEYWNFEFDGDRVRLLTIGQPGTRFGDPVSPLSLAELEQWENWLLETDPNAAARLLPAEDSSQQFPLVPRYDPALADEITGSIQLFIDQRGPGDDITVTDDFVELGDRLVGLIGNMDRVDGRTYVIAGRYETESDLLFAGDEAVLAAFDDTGTELWRTELTGGPVSVVAVDGYVWVRVDSGLTQFDASDGRLVGQITTTSWSEMVAAFGSLWVKVNDENGNPIELMQVDSDRSITTIELPQGGAPSEQISPQGLAAGSDAIWVPLGQGGVARVEADTLDVTVFSTEQIGHAVTQVGVDDDVVYVASNNRVSSIVDGEVVATASLGEFWYMGHVEGVFGIMQGDNRFAVIRPTDPMVVEVVQLSDSGGAGEIDGETWAETGWNYSLQRITFALADSGDV